MTDREKLKVEDARGRASIRKPMTDKQKLEAIRELVELVDKQAEDQVLWMDFKNGATKYIQSELRYLHSKIESFTTEKGE